MWKYYFTKIFYGIDFPGGGGGDVIGGDGDYSLSDLFLFINSIMKVAVALCTLYTVACGIGYLMSEDNAAAGHYKTRMINSLFGLSSALVIRATLQYLLARS